jgi:tetratricopeptide (TPR) repeat protein
MAKKKKSGSTGKGFGSSKQQLIAGLTQAEAQKRRRNWNQALEILKDLEARFPEEPDVYISQVNLFYEVGDIIRYQHACEKLLEVNPNNADATLGLAGSYLGNLRPVLALQKFKQFVEKWPNDQRVQDVSKTIAELEERISGITEDLGLVGEDAVEIAGLHEQAQCYLEIGKIEECKELERQILERRPDFVPALNNLSQAYGSEGNFEKAIECCDQVLNIAPDNFHAISNRCRYLLLNGKVEEAKQQAEVLKTLKSDLIDFEVKKAEAFSFLGDDQSVIETFAEAEKADHLEQRVINPLLFHLAGVAHLRQGNQQEARKLWQQALELNPSFFLSAENLADLNLPVSQRHSPWPFPFSNWSTRKAIDDLVECVRNEENRSEEEMSQATQQYLQQHPEMMTLVPLLLDRGDPPGREFAFRLAKMARTPEMLEALRDFALSNRGPDQQRQEAASVVTEAGILPAGSLKMWMRGKWQDLMMFGFEISDEPVGSHQPQVIKWLAEAIANLKERNGDKAETLLKKALEVEPGDPSLLNNLATAYEQQGRKKEAHELLRQIHAEHPDYLFARTALASIHVHKGELEAAEELLRPILSRRKLHISEFSALCTAEIELSLAKDAPDSARSWLAMWENAYPDHPGIQFWKERLN